MNKKNSLVYEEKLLSNKTEALFIALMLIFLSLALWRVKVHSFDGITIIYTFFSALFLFYSLNYRRLVIRIFPEQLELKFGIFSWTIPFDNVEECRLDESLRRDQKKSRLTRHASRD